MTKANETTTNKKPAPKNLTNYKKAVALGKELSKTPDITKAEVARKMYKLIEDEDRTIVAMAFVEGANLTPKGAMTYVYNVRRQLRKKKSWKSRLVWFKVGIHSSIHLFYVQNL